MSILSADPERITPANAPIGMSRDIAKAKRDVRRNLPGQLSILEQIARYHKKHPVGSATASTYDAKLKKIEAMQEQVQKRNGLSGEDAEKFIVEMARELRRVIPSEQDFKSKNATWNPRSASRAQIAKLHDRQLGSILGNYARISSMRHR